MPSLPERKAGIVSCSGEELAEGTVARLAALKVLHELRPGKTVTICLPLFLAGGEGDRAFARFHPTITVDGCELRCAARGTEMYSGKPAASIVVNEIAAEHGIGRIEGRRNLNEAGKRAVELTAARLAELVDVHSRKGSGRAEAGETAITQLVEIKGAGCACGGNVAGTKVRIAGNEVEVAALPMIFQQLRGMSLKPTDAADELMRMVKIYNYVAPESEESYREVMVSAYAAYCAEKERE